jgi:hypothetical protein
MLEPVREWVGWKGTRQDLEALGDIYLAVPGGIGLVAIGTGCDRPPDEWSEEPGEHPPAWISLETFRDGSGWSAMLHWDLPYPPDPVPGEYRFPPA